MKTVNVSTVMKTMNEWCELNLKETNATNATKPQILCFGAYTLPITERKLTYGYTVEICGIDIYYKVAKAAGVEGSVNEAKPPERQETPWGYHYTKHITINTLSKIFDCERLFIKNIRDKNDCYIVNDRKPRLIRIHANTESFLKPQSGGDTSGVYSAGETVEYVPYSGELLSSLQIKVYKALKNKYDAYINELNNETDSCEITDDMI